MRKDTRKRPAQLNQTASSLKLEVVVQQFLTWYRPKRESFATLLLVPAWLIDNGDTTDIYKVDFKVAEQYLGAFNSSGFVTEKYITNERKNINEADSAMQADQQTFCPSQGLDYDRVTFS